MIGYTCVGTMIALSAKNAVTVGTLLAERVLMSQNCGPK